MGAQMQHQQLMAQQAAVIQQQQLMLQQQGAHWGMQAQPDPYASLYGSSTGAYPSPCTPNPASPTPRLTMPFSPHSAPKPWSPRPALKPETSSLRRTREIYPLKT